jgi:hypothetical protein
MPSDQIENYIIGSSATLFTGETSIIGAQSLPANAGHPVGEPLELVLADLLPDSAGEVVVSAGSGVLLRLNSDVPLRASGVSDPHVTVAGVDVTGLHFYRFESGITIYSPDDIEVSAAA